MLGLLILGLRLNFKLHSMQYMSWLRAKSINYVALAKFFNISQPQKLKIKFNMQCFWKD